MINSPLLVGDFCIGTLNIGSVQHDEPDPAHLEFLQLVATQVAYAIDHVQAYEQIDQLRHQLARENEYLVEELKSTHNFGAMIGLSVAFRKALTQAQAVGPISTTVLVTGETGTGKELMARAIHELSSRWDKPFIRMNCAALPIRQSSTRLIFSIVTIHRKAPRSVAVSQALPRPSLPDSFRYPRLHNVLRFLTALRGPARLLLGLPPSASSIPPGRGNVMQEHNRMGLWQRRLCACSQPGTLTR